MLQIVEGMDPHLIVLDVNVPLVHGLGLTWQVKSDDRLTHIPIIATTANVLHGDRERCFEAGCDDYLPKPFETSDLRLIIRSNLEE